MKRTRQEVPPFVKLIAETWNPGGNTQILELTHPSITGIYLAELECQQAGIYIIRNAIPRKLACHLCGTGWNTFNAVRNAGNYQRDELHKLKATRVGNQDYHSWQALMKQDCICKYGYAGAHCILYKENIPCRQRILTNTTSKDRKSLISLPQSENTYWIHYSARANGEKVMSWIAKPPHRQDMDDDDAPPTPLSPLPCE